MSAPFPCIYFARNEGMVSVDSMGSALSGVGVFGAADESIGEVNAVKSTHHETQAEA